MSRNPFTIWPEIRRMPSLLLLVNELRRALAGCAVVLDVGCGSRSPLRFVAGPHLVGLDGYPPDLETARRLGTHDEYLSGDVRRVTELCAGRRFDACIALDVIEHLPKEDGWEMLDDLERIATRRVVIVTPNGFVPQKSRDGDLQEHLSGWTADEVRARGYQVTGLYGLKQLRCEHHEIKCRPRAFWLMISLLTHWAYARRRPERSAAIFCVKHLHS